MRVLGLTLTMLLFVVTARPQSAADLFKRGNDYSNKGDWSNAIAAYTQALQLTPDSARILSARGYAYYRSYDDDRAIKDFTTAIQLQPDSQLFQARAESFEDKNDYERAIQDYTQAIRLKPGDAHLLYGRAFDYERKGEYAPAIVDLNEIVRRFPEAPDAYRNRGLAFLNSAHLSEAEQDLARAVQINPTDPYNVIWLYIARAKNGSSGEEDLSKKAERLVLAKWPGPVIQLFLGKSKPEIVMQEAADKDPRTTREQQCEAQFYIAEYQTWHDQNGEAVKNFRSVADVCEKNYFLYVPSAHAELLAATKGANSSR